MMRMIKAYGIEKLTEAFPAKHIKLLRNVKRVDRRTKKNKDKVKKTYESELDEIAKKI